MTLGKSFLRFFFFNDCFFYYNAHPHQNYVRETPCKTIHNFLTKRKTVGFFHHFLMHRIGFFSASAVITLNSMFAKYLPQKLYFVNLFTLKRNCSNNYSNFSHQKTICRLLIK